MEAYIWLFLYYWYWSSAKNVIAVQEFPVKIMKLECVDTALKEITVGSWSDCSFAVEQNKQQHPEQVPEGESKRCHIPTAGKQPPSNQPSDLHRGFHAGSQPRLRWHSSFVLESRALFHVQQELTPGYCLHSQGWGDELIAGQPDVCWLL